MDTPLGQVRFKKPRKPQAAVIVALGQSEEHLRWFYDVYRKDYLTRAVANLEAYEHGKKDPSTVDFRLLRVDPSCSHRTGEFSTGEGTGFEEESGEDSA